MNNSEYWKDNDKYHERQGEKGSVVSNIVLFDSILTHLDGVDSLVEFGAGEGKNLDAIGQINQGIMTTGVEVNPDAAVKIPCDVLLISDMFDLQITESLKSDLVLTKGLLIHIPPDKIKRAYDILYQASKRYILIAEYYNPTLMGVSYQGRADLLWKRDFAGEMMDKYPDLELVDYGFVYHRDRYPQDDITWFLMEKINEQV